MTVQDSDCVVQASKDDLPHILFYGPSGVGKKTLIEALLLEIYGEGVKKVHSYTVTRTFEVSGRNVDVTMSHIASNYHMDLTPSTVGNKDRLIVQRTIKELCAQRPPHVIDPIRSRCLCIRVPSPSGSEVQEVLQSIAKAEDIDLPNSFAQNIAAESRGSLRRAILALEVSHAQQYPFVKGQDVPIPDWELYIKVIAEEMLTSPSVQTALRIRGRLYELYVNCVPPTVMIKNLTLELLPKMGRDDVGEVCKHAAIFEDKINHGGNPIMHLEAFVLRVMSIHKKRST